MTVTQSLIAFLLAAGLLTITPGLDVALVLRTVMAQGAKQGAQAALGIVTGCLFWGGATAFGVGALLAASAVGFTMLKWIGGCYLLWLGVRLIVKPRAAVVTPSAAPARSNPPRSGWFWQGLLQNLFNPKVGVFYISFLPQFLPQGVPVIDYTFLLAALHAALSLAWFAVLILATQPLMRLLRRPHVLGAMDRLTGAVFVGFGMKLFLSRR